MSTQKKRLGDILIDCNLISDEQLKQALGFQKERGLKLGEALTEMGLVTEDDIIWALGNQLNISFVHLNADIVDHEVVQMITPDFAREHRMMLLYKAGNQLSVCMVDPLDSRPVEYLEGKFGVNVQVSICTLFDFEQTFSAIYGATEITDKVADEIESTPAENTALERGIPKGMEGPEKIINYILGQAIINKVDRIHFEPTDKGVLIRFRTNCTLSRKIEVPMKVHHEVISRLRKLSHLPDDEKNRLGVQVGHFRVNVSSRLVNIQSIFYPTVDGEMVILKLADFGSIAEQLGKTGRATLEKIGRFLHDNYGVLYVTGPRESGRTTTQYCILSSYDSETRKIVTVEDPVEASLTRTTQIQVGHVGVTNLSDGFKLAMLLDPDVIHVESADDAKLVEEMAYAGLGGKTIMTSFLAHDAPSSIVRLINMGGNDSKHKVDPVILASSMCGIVCQRLVRTLCKNCREATTLPERIAERLPAEKHGAQVFKAKGCEGCEKTGYSGKMLIVEFIPNSPTLKQMIINKQSYQDFYQFARKEGYPTLEQSALELLVSGETSVDEFQRLF
jgi:type IV pilus assembly protein PilB